MGRVLELPQSIMSGVNCSAGNGRWSEEAGADARLISRMRAFSEQACSVPEVSPMQGPRELGCGVELCVVIVSRWPEPSASDRGSGCRGECIMTRLDIENTGSG